MRFSFIHASDLHLGSPFSAAASRDQALARMLRQTMFDAFSRLVAEAVERQVDFMVLSGDTFDLERVPPAVWLKFISGVRVLEGHGIRVYMVCGNHDPYEGLPVGAGLPENLMVFQPDSWQSAVHERGGVPLAAISGISFKVAAERANLASRLGRQRPEQGLFHLAVLHANVGGRPGHEPYAPCSLDDLLSKEVDYWALGHIHERLVLHQAPHAAYPGVIQGRSFREQGVKGAFYCEVKGRQLVEHAFLPLSSVVFAERRVDVSGAQDLAQIEEALIKEAQQAEGGCHMVLRFVLEGRTPLSGELSDQEVQDGLLEAVNYGLSAQMDSGEDSVKDHVCTVASLKDRTMPEMDLDRRAKAEDFAALVLKERERILGQAEEGTEELKEALRDLFENPRFSRLLQEIGPEELEGLMDEAARLAVWRLDPPERPQGHAASVPAASTSRSDEA